MGYFGFFAQELHGETFQQNMDIGKMFIADFADGGIKGGEYSSALIDDADLEWFGLQSFKILCKEATPLS